MNLRSVIHKLWALLSPSERRNAIWVLVVMILAALGSAAMVGSVFPFLSVLANPDLIRDVPALTWAYGAGGFDSDYSFLVALGLGAIAVIVVSNLLLILQSWATIRFMQMRLHSISERLLARYLAQPYDYFIARHSGDMSTNILSEIQMVVVRVLTPLANLVASLLTVLAVMVTVLLIEPVATGTAIGIFAAIYITITLVSRGYVRRQGERRAEANQGRFRIAGEALGGIKDVKLLGREGAYLDKYAHPSSVMAQSQIGVELLGAVPRYVIQIVAFGGIIVLCLVFLEPEGLEEREALGGILPLIGLLAFAGQRLMPEFNKLYQAITTITAGTAALDRVYTDLVAGVGNTQPDRSAPPALGLRKALQLRGVSYTYPNADNVGLDEVTLEIRAGERIGIVGASGAGKTTLADVVLGLLTPQTGSVVTDGRTITPETLRAWQRSVGYVPQDIFLIDASLSENIALGLPADEIDPTLIERAARIASLHDFAISELPAGYATQIGERGVRLSGGQRQRIGIARALYHDADLIVFDEATSALDNLTEREVMEAIEALPGDKTVLMIAHRLSTVRRCDRIVLMEGGRVEACGPWDALVESSAAFRKIAHAA